MAVKMIYIRFYFNVMGKVKLIMRNCQGQSDKKQEDNEMEYYFIYYAVAGPNGYGVYVSDAALTKSLVYMKDAQVRTCIDVNEAKWWAEYMYVQQQSEIMPVFDEIKRLNWCYYKKNLSGKQYSELKLVRGVFYN